MNTDTWFLVADSSRARLYSVPQRGKPWALVSEHRHDLSRVTAGGLTTDQPGRSHGSSIGKSLRSVMESKSSPKEIEVGHFVHELVEVLHHGHGQQAFQQLVLVAPPHFLGLLRKGLNDTVSKLVTASFDKDYTQLSKHELQVQMDGLLKPVDAAA